MSVLTLPEAAERLGVSARTVRRMAKRYLDRTADHDGWELLPPQQGEIAAVRMGHPAKGKIKIPTFVVERMVAA